jgi:hypothetical protein
MYVIAINSQNILILYCCSRFGITRDDIFRGVNDTTNSAIMAGRLLSSGRNPATQNTCHMHSQELV